MPEVMRALFGIPMVLVIGAALVYILEFIFTTIFRIFYPAFQTSGHLVDRVPRPHVGHQGPLPTG